MLYPKIATTKLGAVPELVTVKLRFCHSLAIAPWRALPASSMLLGAALPSHDGIVPDPFELSVGDITAVFPRSAMNQAPFDGEWGIC